MALPLQSWPILKLNVIVAADVLILTTNKPEALPLHQLVLGFVPGVLSGSRVVRREWAVLDPDPAHEEDCLFVHTSVVD